MKPQNPPPENSSNWDLNRFVKTLAYFDVIPFSKTIEKTAGWLFSQFSEGNSATQSQSNIQWDDVVKDFGKGSANSTIPNGPILVAGAASLLGKQVIQHLCQHGYEVRSLDRNDSGWTVLDDHHKVISEYPELTQALTGDAMADVVAVLCCLDSEQLEPSDSVTHKPQSLQQLTEALIEAGSVHLADSVNASRSFIFNFHQPPIQPSIQPSVTPSDSLNEFWGALDDVVMGGASQSSMRRIERQAVFSGNVSTSNSGGFASVRTKNLPVPLDLSAYKGIALRVKGDGKRYKFMLRTETKWDGVAYCYSFDTVADRWIDLYLPFTDFIPVFRARTVETALPIPSDRIVAFQLMLSKFEYDGALNPKFTPGLFQLQLDSIQVYGGKALPQFILVQSVPRGNDTEPSDPLAVASLDISLNTLWQTVAASLRRSGMIYTIIRTGRLSTISREQSLAIAPGDLALNEMPDEVSSAAMAELCVQVLATPQAGNTTFSVITEDSKASTTALNSNPDHKWTEMLTKLQPDP